MRCFIRRFGHYAITLLLVLGSALAGQQMLSAKALRDHQATQVTTREVQLQELNRRRQALVRQRQQLQQVRAFEERVAQLGLQREDWLFYNVNVQGAFPFEAARRLIEQCADSQVAYYWPASLEILAEGPTADGRRGSSADRGDVRLSIKGQFVAKKE
ncbi:hypothetical protein [Desulfatitalea alkaliphila]|uniref:Type IV pilus assembly protein PilN n=1 Tax=Desulfatitalea alkaliphila TaxID=2929485 RepID=A0AA41R5F3_9BACT|nr:hypothetical protein [Desulfatitalea alkaliphila]MCJ8502146.1 hypothetical protein [Desulfatitalea alkaliphila]